VAGDEAVYEQAAIIIVAHDIVAHDLFMLVDAAK